MRRPVRIATRGSRLALRQVEIVSERLHLEVEPVIVSTLGDRRRDLPLRTIAGIGAFSNEVRSALAAGAADLAVHSAKDLPAIDDDRFITAFPPRADPRDALIGATLAELPTGGIVATGAPRRRVQLAALRPDLRFTELRGNIETRLRKTSNVDAVVVAAAALERLDTIIDGHVLMLPVEEIVPQVGQGALAVDARRDDAAARALLAVIDDSATRAAVTVERGFLAALDGDCDLPAGAHAVVGATGAIELHTVLADQGGHLVRHTAAGHGSDALGATAAGHLRRMLRSATSAVS